MRDEPIDLDTLLMQFGKLGRRDRNAVLAQLAPAERDRVEAAIFAQGDARRRDADRIRRTARQFAGYSPWLAGLLQRTCANDDDMGTAASFDLSGPARNAVADIHRSLLNEGDAQPRSMMAQWRAWSSALFSPQPVKRP